MEFGKVRGRWAIAIAALAALVVATAWQPAVAQDKPAAQDPPATKADQPAQPQQADKMVKDKPAQEDGKKAAKPEQVTVPGKKSAVRQPTDRAAHVNRRGESPKPTVQLKPGEVPGIKFDTPVYDFGRVKSGTEITHDFWFTNTGTGPLEIIRAKPS